MARRRRGVWTDLELASMYLVPYFVKKKFNVHMYTLTQSQRREGTRVAVLAIRRSVRLRSDTLSLDAGSSHSFTSLTSTQYLSTLVISAWIKRRHGHTYSDVLTYCTRECNSSDAEVQHKPGTDGQPCLQAVLVCNPC